jgi:predicted transcriptional regulator of viral defense system
MFCSHYLLNGFRGGIVDWASVLTQEAKTSAIIRSDLLAHKYNLPLQSVRVTLRRQEKRGLVERVRPRIYVNKLASGFSARDLAIAICPESYVSLDSALNEWGVSSQSPALLTCVTTSQIPPIKVQSAQIRFRTIKASLFWGFQERKSRYTSYKIAEPEKALLDLIYFRRKDRLPVELDEFNFQHISRSKLIKYAGKYPTTVLQTLYPIMIEQQFAA